MKFTLILILVLAFSLIGILIYLNYNSKKNVYKCLVDFCDCSLLEIKFNKTNFKKIINKYIKSCNFEMKNILNSYLERKPYNSKILNSEENEVVQNFLCSIGKKDVDGEVDNISKYKEIFKLSYEKAKEDEKKHGVISLKISIVIGLLLAIILI